jgi:hypothetical protein
MEDGQTIIVFVVLVVVVVVLIARRLTPLADPEPKDGFLTALTKTAQWNNDPFQKRLAKLIMDGAAHNASGFTRGEELNFRDVLALTREAGWSDKEAANRFVHAVSMIKPVADERTYQAAKSLALNLYNAYANPMNSRG